MKRKPLAVTLKPWLVGILIISTIQFLRNSWILRILVSGSVEENVMTKNHIIQENIHRLGPIFYNVFIPENDAGRQENALRIVKEQMLQRRWSDPSLQNTPIWYTIIGSSNMTNEDCHPSCQRIAYLKKGDEVNTLQSLWEYCQDHSDKLVTYIHNKGSFHHTDHNEHTRRTATKSALDCRNEMVKSPDMSPYNVCAGTMIILPQYLCQANMWSAKCSYVRNLYSPKSYATVIQRMYKETLLHPTLSQEHYSCLRPIHLKDNHLGLGRYAYERWVWSHPDVVPADVIPMGHLNFTEFPPQWRPMLSRSLKGSPKRMHLHKGFGESSFARLEGRLFEWNYIYQRAPQNNSWIWDYYRGFETGSPAFKVRYC